MNTLSTKDTVKGIKDLQQQVQQWEFRLESIKTDIESLHRNKAALDKEIEDRKTLFNQESEKRTLEIRKLQIETNEAVAKLKSDKSQYDEDLVKLQSEKASVNILKQKVEKQSEDYRVAMENIGRFVTIVKRESGSL